MSTVAVGLRYRPLRIGWCVEQGDFEAFRRAARLSFTMWGGRFNPIVSIGDAKVAKALVSLFRVDALFPVTETAEVKGFAEGFKHLPWPFINDELFTLMREGQKGATVVDISHPAIRIYNESFKHNPTVEPGLELYEWEEADPLSDLFLSTYGAFPPPEETGTDYRALVQASLRGVGGILRNGQEVPPLPIGRYTIASLNRAEISRHYAVQNHWDQPGFYLGEIDNFDDLVLFWNLRAADIPLFFFDPRYSARLRIMATRWKEAIRQAPPGSHGPDGIAIWHRAERPIEADRAHFGDGRIVDHRIGEMTWNGLNVRAPIMYFGTGSALASVSEGAGAHNDFVRSSWSAVQRLVGDEQTALRAVHRPRHRAIRQRARDPSRAIHPRT